MALDGEGRNSPFTTALLKHLGTTRPERHRRPRDGAQGVLEATQGKQVPGIIPPSPRPVILKEAPKVDAKPEPQPEAKGAAPATDKRRRACILGRHQRTPETSRLLEAYLEQYPGGAFAKLARIKIDVLKASAGHPNSKRAIADSDGSGSFDRSKLERLDPSKTGPAKPATPTQAPEAVELALNLAPGTSARFRTRWNCSGTRRQGKRATFGDRPCQLA